MRSNLYFKAYRDHPYLKQHPVSNLYGVQDNDQEDTYLYFDPIVEELFSVNLVQLRYSNLGDPFREFCELVMTDCDNESLHYMFLDREAAWLLWIRGVHTTDDVVKSFKWEERLTSD